MPNVYDEMSEAFCIKNNFYVISFFNAITVKSALEAQAQVGEKSRGQEAKRAKIFQPPPPQNPFPSTTHFELFQSIQSKTTV